MSHSIKALRYFVYGLLCLFFLPITSVARAEEKKPVLVFAAASLKNAMDEVSSEFSKKTDIEVVVSYGASSTLARQIEHGAPADIYISANTAWMDHLETVDVIEPTSRQDLLANRLVLISSAFIKAPAPFQPGTSLNDLIGDGRLAVAMVDSVPAGIYAKEALINLGQWDDVKNKLAQTDNVRSATALVARGESDYGIVYASDLAAAREAELKLRLISRIPAESHSPIRYPLAKIAGHHRLAVDRFYSYLKSPDAQEIFTGFGFGLIAQNAPGE